jgi:hypothetical protein
VYRGDNTKETQSIMWGQRIMATEKIWLVFERKKTEGKAHLICKYVYADSRPTEKHANLLGIEGPFKNQKSAGMGERKHILSYQKKVWD